MKMTMRILSLVFLMTSMASAEMVGVDVDIHEDVLGGKSWGLSGPYEKMIGTMYFEVDPSNSANEIIVDIEHAPTNAQGNVEFAANFVLIKPKQVERGNGTQSGFFTAHTVVHTCARSACAVTSVRINCTSAGSVAALGRTTNSYGHSQSQRSELTEFQHFHV